MAEALRTDSREQDVEKAQEKRKRAEPTLEHIKALAGESISFPGLLGVSAMELPAERHAALLGDPCFSHLANDGQKARMVTELQQTYGNQYVQRLVQSTKVQAKLSISSLDDEYEREADKAADTVTRTSAYGIQRQVEAEDKEEPEEEEEEEEPEVEVRTMPLLQRKAVEEGKTVEAGEAIEEVSEEEAKAVLPGNKVIEDYWKKRKGPGGRKWAAEIHEQVDQIFWQDFKKKPGYKIDTKKEPTLVKAWFRILAEVLSSAAPKPESKEPLKALPPRLRIIVERALERHQEAIEKLTERMTEYQKREAWIREKVGAGVPGLGGACLGELQWEADRRKRRIERYKKNLEALKEAVNTGAEAVREWYKQRDLERQDDLRHYKGRIEDYTKRLAQAMDEFKRAGSDEQKRFWEEVVDLLEAEIKGEYEEIEAIEKQRLREELREASQKLTKV